MCVDFIVMERSQVDMKVIWFENFLKQLVELR